MPREIGTFAQIVALISALALLSTALVWLGEIKRSLDIIEEVQMGRRIFALESDVRAIKERLGMGRGERDHFGD